ncbi:MAG: glycosyltransferase family 4 protein [Chitinophagales bacterium]|nr:glycosyltransferase family 4 protein [Chitinophagaceae bacterium]MCB9065393.1 glycosyltransferase family 4 protein [Chitinophagales bacterium]
MRVLQVIDRLAVGGAEKVFTFLSNLLSDNNIKTGILLFNTGYPLEKELNDSITIHDLNRGNKYNLVTLHKAHKFCSNYDIVHAHLRHVYTYIRLAQMIFGGKYKVILHDHAAINTPSFRLTGKFKPTYYIGVNKEQTDWAKSTLNIKGNNTFLLENTVSRVSDKHVPSDTDRLMMVANIRRVKNIEYAIGLCKQLNIGLTIYGHVIDQDYYEELLGLAADTNIIINTGDVDVRSEYNKYSLAIHCSPKETGPLVLLEYLSAGIPFIAYKTGSAAEAIAKELPILFMEKFDTDEWSTRIKEITADNTLYEKMRALYQKSFTPQQYLENCLEIYKSVHS